MTREMPEDLPFYAVSGECGVSPKYIAALRELLGLKPGNSLYAAVAELAACRPQRQRAVSADHVRRLFDLSDAARALAAEMVAE